ncbi:hypothetical protein E2562_016394 [Oryza meyeriana var. granulata]|uniref:Uncharacterized protein n=1 Tax=Oryza meyeriana var. granulata TaxID=110450 RepID=A0A6G1EX22_9ORYZ|nr:hypothetical protein E2562_016394 [Oryza meyeriana var. granulata]
MALRLAGNGDSDDDSAELGGLLLHQCRFGSCEGLVVRLVGGIAASNVEYRCFVRGPIWATDDCSLEAAFSPYGEILESKNLIRMVFTDNLLEFFVSTMKIFKSWMHNL